MKMTDKTYNSLKWIAQYLLPALATLYFALSSIWGIPYGEQVVGTLTALDVFLGVILGISSAAYNKLPGDGALMIDTTTSEVNKYRLAITTPLESLPDRKTITLKIEPNSNLSSPPPSQE